ncbi:hypothetical protein F4821DRAFT_228537 [Hypoxylon rubiginosum]|uniref:Uncharacterized protein n=1 Tax=Hypoxylon rubiginosum TaxID=110542 RepID=A0ACC0DD37_9PEZI|nr:hypothetical protein F4821DRAFT_228537 [Hypoxylon rubiginosum]
MLRLRTAPHGLTASSLFRCLTVSYGWFIRIDARACFIIKKASTYDGKRMVHVIFPVSELCFCAKENSSRTSPQRLPTQPLIHRASPSSLIPGTMAISVPYARVLANVGGAEGPPARRIGRWLKPFYCLGQSMRKPLGTGTHGT